MDKTLNVLLTGDPASMKRAFASAVKSSTAAKVGLGGVVAAAAVAGKALYDLGEEFDEANDRIRVGTGATGKRLRLLEGDFKGVVATVPTDFESASTAIADLNTRLGLTGKPLRERSRQFLELSRITGSDLTGDIEAVTRTFGDWEVATRDQGKALDLIFRASQASGAGVSDLSEQVVKFGAPLRQVGFSLEEAVAMFAEFEKVGVNTQTMMPGLKQAMKVFFEEDVDPKEGILKTFKGIEDGTIKTSEALKIFGTRAGGDMVEAIEQGRFHLKGFTKQLIDGNDTIRKAGTETQDTAEKMQILGNKLKVELEPAASAVFDTVAEFADILASPKLDAGEKFDKITSKLEGLVEDGFEAAVSSASEFGPKIALSLGDSLLGAWTNLDPLEKLFGAAVILRAVGGKGAIVGAGRSLGGLLGLGVSEGTATTVAGGAAGSSGGLMGKIKGIKWKRAAGLGLGLVLADSVMNEMGREMAAQSDDIFEALGAKADTQSGLEKTLSGIWGAIGGSGKIDAPSFSQILGLDGSQQAAKNLSAQFDELKEKRVRLSAETVTSLENQAKEVDLTEKQREGVSKIIALMRQGSNLHIGVDAGMDPGKLAKLSGGLNALKGGLLAGSKDIEQVAKRNQAIINGVFGHGTKEGRELTARNLRAIAHAYQVNMDEAGKHTKAGMEHVKSLIRRADLMQASRQQARGFAHEWASGMDRSQEITKGGVQHMIHELKLMPPASRAVAVQTWTAQLREARDKGEITKQEFRKLRSRVVSEFQGIKAEGKTSITGLMNMLPEFARKSQRNIADLGGGAWLSYKGAVHKTGTGVKTDVRGIERASVGAMTNTIGTLNAGLIALNLSPVAFEHHQRGSLIRGAGTGDKVPALLEPGEYVLNREAVAAIGTSTLDAINFTMAPRFQKGGIFGAEPQVTGTGPVHDVGQASAHRIYKAAKRYWNLHNGKARVIAEGNRMSALKQPYLWSGGHGSVADPNGPWDCSGGISELFNGAGWSFAPMVSSGFMSWGLPGKGEVSVLANPDHVYAVVEGKGAIGTSGENPGGGFGWISGYTFRPGFTIRHADFSEAGMAARVSGRRGKGQEQAKGFQKGGMVTGKVTWFNESENPGEGTAGGSTTSRPGLALNLNPGTDSGWNNATTQRWMTLAREGHPVYGRTTIGGKTANLPITDLGPAGWTGNAIDVTEGGVRKLGFTTSTFPSGTTGKVVILDGTGSGSTKEDREARRKRRRRRAHADPKTGGMQAPAAAAKGKSSEPVRVAPPAVSIPKILQGPGMTAVESLFQAPGMSREDRWNAAEAALKIAEQTPQEWDEGQVLKYQLGSSKQRKHAIQKEIQRLNKRLAGRLTDKQRRQIEAKRRSLVEELGTVQGRIETAREGLKPDEDEEDPAVKAAEELKEAMEEMATTARELKESIDEQNAIAGSELSIGLAEAKRALADVISGQLGPKAYNASLAVGAGYPGSAATS